MRPDIYRTPGRLYLTWNYPDGPTHTRAFPIEAGFVFCQDANELLLMAEQMGIDPDTLHAVPTEGTWEAPCMPVASIPVT
jgi:hypothetical protein